jgi:N-acetylmuramoyl-L-alanine amidase CwlA
MTPKGIIVHSTGVNNPYLKRYVGPDDERLGHNPNDNHWNRPGVDKCVHAFIGKDKKGRVCTYCTLPLDICAWGAGKGKKGSYNYKPAYLQFEILEDELKDKTYFNKVMKEAQELCAKWCKEYKIPVKDVISHSEAHARGYASNHADCDHWLKRFGKNMTWFRNEVEALMKADKSISVGDKVKVKAGVTEYYDGKKVSSWVKKTTLYARRKEIKSGKEVWLVSTNKLLPVYTGRFKATDIVKQ